MKLTILVDNNTFIDQYYHGEPALSLYIEEDGKRILFDTGYSEIVLTNAEKMGIDLSKITHLVLSHGHDDHTRGLQFLNEKIDLSKVEAIAHPKCFLPKYVGDLYVGSPYTQQQIEEITSYRHCKEPYYLSEKLIYLGEIPRKNQFENQKPIGKYVEAGEKLDDYLKDDTAMVYQSEQGLFVITGCSHSGICNIIEYAKEVCKTDKVYGVLGGFHLFHDDEQLRNTISYFQENQIQLLYPCHCVSLLARFKMMEKLPVIETGVGMVLEIA